MEYVVVLSALGGRIAWVKITATIKPLHVRGEKEGREVRNLSSRVTNKLDITKQDIESSSSDLLNTQNTRHNNGDNVLNNSLGVVHTHLAHS